MAASCGSAGRFLPHQGRGGTRPARAYSPAASSSLNTVNTHRGAVGQPRPSAKGSGLRRAERSPCYNGTPVLISPDGRPPGSRQDRARIDLATATRPARAESGHRNRHLLPQGAYWQITAPSITVQTSPPGTEPRPRWPSRPVPICVRPGTSRPRCTPIGPTADAGRPVPIPILSRPLPRPRPPSRRRALQGQPT